MKEGRDMRRLGFGLVLVGAGLGLPAIAQVSVAPQKQAPAAGTKAPVAKAAPAAKAAATPGPAVSVSSGTPSAQAAPAGSAATSQQAKAVAKPGAQRECTRLPLSDIQFGRENTINVARQKLEDYAQKVARERGWKNGYTRSNETATCEDYLWLPIGGQEYKCLVTATFCRK